MVANADNAKCNTASMLVSITYQHKVLKKFLKNFKKVEKSF